MPTLSDAIGLAAIIVTLIALQWLQFGMGQ